MPRERSELTRGKEFLQKGKIFILSYEGNDTEPQYYEALRDLLKYKDNIVHIESLKRDKKDTNSAPKYVFKKLKEKKAEYNFSKTDEFWMIIDKDRWVLNEWVEKCKDEENFYIALSNPCFEFWLLLHFKSIVEFSEEILQSILENKKVSTSRRYIDKLLSDILENGYNKKNINPKRFLERIEQAIKEAEDLDASDVFENLGTHNYKLVKKLLE